MKSFGRMAVLGLVAAGVMGVGCKQRPAEEEIDVVTYAQEADPAVGQESTNPPVGQDPNQSVLESTPPPTTDQPATGGSGQDVYTDPNYQDPNYQPPTGAQPMDAGTMMPEDSTGGSGTEDMSAPPDDTSDQGTMQQQEDLSGARDAGY